MHEEGVPWHLDVHVITAVLVYVQPAGQDSAVVVVAVANAVVQVGVTSAYVQPAGQTSWVTTGEAAANSVVHIGVVYWVVAVPVQVAGVLVVGEAIVYVQPPGQSPAVVVAAAAKSTAQSGVTPT